MTELNKMRLGVLRELKNVHKRALTTFLRKCNISKFTIPHKGYRGSLG
jgi:hypothetical protein